MPNYKAQNRGIFSAVKKADQTKTSDDTPAADTELTLPVKASKTYAFMCTMIVKAHATPDFSFDFSGPSGATGGYKILAWNPNIPSTERTIGTAMLPSTDDTVQLIETWGYMIISSTAGNLALSWAQKTSDANATIVKAGSMLTIWEST